MRGADIISNFYHICGHCVTTPCCADKKHCHYVKLSTAHVFAVSRHCRTKVILSRSYCAIYTYNMASTTLNYVLQLVVFLHFGIRLLEFWH